MEVELVTVTVDGKQQRLPAHIAAARMVERYGEDVYTQEVLAKRSAFFAYWREVDEAIVAKIGEEELRRRVVTLVERKGVPGLDLLDILSAYGAFRGR